MYNRARSRSQTAVDGHLGCEFEQGQIELTTNTEVIQEVLYVLSRRGDRPVAVEVARDLLDLFVDCCPLRGRIF